MTSSTQSKTIGTDQKKVAFNSRTIKLIGHLETISPVTVSLPELKGVMPKNTHGSTYIPAGSIRGMFRHVAHFAIAQLLAKKGELLSVDEHIMLANGVDNGRQQNLKGNGTEKIGLNKEVREANPMLSMFGNFLIDSRLKVGSAISDPNQKVLHTVGLGSRNAVFNNNPELIGFVQAEDLDYLNETLMADRKTAESLESIRAEKKQLERQNKTASKEEQKENYARISEIDLICEETKNNRTGSRNSIRMVLPGTEAIDQNVKLSHRMTLQNPTDDELAFFFWMLTKASTNFNIGGHRNIGCGDIKGHWRIITSSYDNPTPVELGQLTIDDNGFKLEGLNFDYKAFEEKILSGNFDFKKCA